MKENKSKGENFKIKNKLKSFVMKQLECTIENMCFYSYSLSFVCMWMYKFKKGKCVIKHCILYLILDQMKLWL